MPIDVSSDPIRKLELTAWAHAPGTWFNNKRYKYARGNPNETRIRRRKRRSEKKAAIQTAIEFNTDSIALSFNASAA